MLGAGIVGVAVVHPFLLLEVLGLHLAVSLSLFEHVFKDEVFGSLEIDLFVDVVDVFINVCALPEEFGSLPEQPELHSHRGPSQDEQSHNVDIVLPLDSRPVVLPLL